METSHQAQLFHACHLHAHLLKLTRLVSVSQRERQECKFEEQLHFCFHKPTDVILSPDKLSSWSVSASYLSAYPATLRSEFR